MKIIIFLITILFLSGCQANYIRDVQGGTVAPSDPLLVIWTRA
ncbi:colicin release lysis protein [Escherichia coli]